MPEVERHPRQSIGGLWGVALFLSLPLRFQPESVIHRGCSALFRYLIFDVADVRLERRQPGPPRFVPGGPFSLLSPNQAADTKHQSDNSKNDDYGTSECEKRRYEVCQGVLANSESQIEQSECSNPDKGQEYRRERMHGWLSLGEVASSLVARVTAAGANRLEASVQAPWTSWGLHTQQRPEGPDCRQRI